ncbi:hypothetical protein L226DRAFT_564430 [Lentinus tigrinus ALCF2SS1-7]|uniref:uncharacterized protein n=1 Tax=Lentinus tigrinus ALCF2SS1-7 TaxID=1328758 RepID=UPI00116618D0|nr:hypothetical protein L226DRAFT_564430 [Lentinus tigrinus ALCF2SS1-7]
MGTHVAQRVPEEWQSMIGHAPSRFSLPPHVLPLVLTVVTVVPDARRHLRTSKSTCSSRAVGVPMPKRERDEAVADLSSTIFSAMLEEILMDVVQQSHKEIARSRAVCDEYSCGAVHVPGSSNNASGSRIPTPTGEARPGDGNSPMATGSNTPVNGSNGTVYFECLECKRQVASNRFATHLSGCMGLNNRRGAARNASAKSKLGNELGKSGSPRLVSEATEYFDDPKPAPKKGKSKAKKDDSLNSNGKRTGSPSVSPTKKPTKKAKVTGSPAAAGRVKADSESPVMSHLLPPGPNASRVPSKLRASSTVSSLHRERRSSSPDSPARLSSPAHSISTQASTAMRSPVVTNSTLKSRQANGKGRGAPAPPRIPSPPRPPPPVPVIKRAETDYLIDVEGGDETGSSTDTDSD